jgi:hypothetical protein
MKLILIALVLAVVAKAAEPDTAVLIADVRSIVTAPDQWTDMTDELRKLDSLAKRCQEKKKGAVLSFRQSLASYSAYFADHPFTLSADERAALVLVLRSYEERFALERDRILASWREHPDQDHGCVDAATRALTVADFELEKCAPIFAPHNSRSDRPNELAAVVIGVVARYGLFLALLTEEPISEGSAAPERAAGPRLNKPVSSED